MILAELLTFIIAYFLTSYLSRPTSRICVLDYPSSRSLHGRVVPRTGGLAILGASIVGSLLISLILPDFSPSFYPLFGFVPLTVMSFLDDRCGGVPFQWRLSVHVWAAASLILAGYAPDRLELLDFTWLLSDWIAIFYSLLFTVWMINLYNFMDGMDGFAGGMAVIGFLHAGLAGSGRQRICSTFCLIGGGGQRRLPGPQFSASQDFPGRYRLHRAWVFWRRRAACGAAKAGLFPFWVAILVFSPFIVDATATLLRRLLRREKVWEAHRTHYYQRLVLLGWGHRGTVLAGIRLDAGLCRIGGAGGSSAAGRPTEHYWAAGR
ncbi:MAG: UDP-phosphate N-acetylglucosaminyl 1-phosphate transferase [Candidatus Competibacter sp.]